MQWIVDGWNVGATPPGKRYRSCRWQMPVLAYQFVRDKFDQRNATRRSMECNKCNTKPYLSCDFQRSISRLVTHPINGPGSAIERHNRHEKTPQSFFSKSRTR